MSSQRHEPTRCRHGRAGLAPKCGIGPPDAGSPNPTNGPTGSLHVAATRLAGSDHPIQGDGIVGAER